MHFQNLFNLPLVWTALEQKIAVNYGLWSKRGPVDDKISLQERFNNLRSTSNKILHKNQQPMSHG